MKKILFFLIFSFSISAQDRAKEFKETKEFILKGMQEMKLDSHPLYSGIYLRLISSFPQIKFNEKAKQKINYSFAKESIELRSSYWDALNFDARIFVVTKELLGVIGYESESEPVKLSQKIIQSDYYKNYFQAIEDDLKEKQYKSEMIKDKFRSNFKKLCSGTYSFKPWGNYSEIYSPLYIPILGETPLKKLTIEDSFLIVIPDVIAKEEEKNLYYRGLINNQFVDIQCSYLTEETVQFIISFSFKNIVLKVHNELHGILSHETSIVFNSSLINSSLINSSLINSSLIDNKRILSRAEYFSGLDAYVDYPVHSHNHCPDISGLGYLEVSEVK